MAEDAAGKGYMGKKDISGKEFFAERRRFAELFNAVIYQKKEVIHAETTRHFQEKGSWAGTSL